MKSLRLRLSIWFGASFLVVTALFLAIAYQHLDHELRQEKWERAHPDHSDWVLHGSYSDAEVRDIIGELVRISLMVSVPMVATALFIGYYLARRSTRPVAELNAQLQTIHPANLGSRVRVAEDDPEFRSVQEQVNGLLGRLDRSFRQLNEFSGQVAHELRTPLTLLRLQVEHAADRIDPELSESLQDELGRLSGYVDQALLMARAEQGRLPLHLHSLDLCELLEEMLDVYRILAAEQHRLIEMRCDARCQVRADPEHLRRIFHNLITNALKHGEGRVCIHIYQRGSTAVCNIANRVGPARPREDRGMGLGLRLVAALASAHGPLGFRTRRMGQIFAAQLTSPLDRAVGLQERKGRPKSSPAVESSTPALPARPG